MKGWLKEFGILVATAGLAILIERFLLEKLNARIRKSFESVPSTLEATGRRMSSDEASRQEALVRAIPSDINVRGLLLGYYGRSAASPLDIEKYQEHALWIVQHKPDHPMVSLCRLDQTDAYERGKQLWLHHCELNPRNITILTNAANYFSLEDRDIAEPLLQRVKLLQSSKHKWAKRLLGS